MRYVPGTSVPFVISTDLFVVAIIIQKNGKTDIIVKIDKITSVSYTHLVRTLGGTKKDILVKVVLPENFPALIGAMKINVGLCLVGVIIGEFLAANAGLGYLKMCIRDRL